MVSKKSTKLASKPNGKAVVKKDPKDSGKYPEYVDLSTLKIFDKLGNFKIRVDLEENTDLKRVDSYDPSQL